MKKVISSTLKTTIKTNFKDYLESKNLQCPNNMDLDQKEALAKQFKKQSNLETIYNAFDDRTKYTSVKLG